MAPSVPSNPIITWRSPFFFFSPSTPVFLRLLRVFFFFNITRERLWRGRRLLIRKDPEALLWRCVCDPGESTAASFPVQLLRHYFSGGIRNLLAIPVNSCDWYCCGKRRQHSTCSASIHPSICGSRGRSREKPDSFPFSLLLDAGCTMYIIYFYSEFLRRRHVISSVFARYF